MGTIDPGVGLNPHCEGVWSHYSHGGHRKATVGTEGFRLTEGISFEMGFLFSALTDYFQKLATYRKNKSPLISKSRMRYLT